jgi:anti-sigma-K factor RskA
MTIDERLQELAGLYVLGALDGAELREFETALDASPELRQFVARLHPAVEAVADSIPVAVPPPELRARILAQIEPQKVLTLPERPWAAALGWWRALATGLAVVCVVLLGSNRQLRQSLAADDQQLGQLHQLAQTLEAATNDLNQAVLALRESNRLANLRITMLNSLVADAPKTVAVTLWDYQMQGGVFVVQNLKPLPASQDYELWVMDEHKNPVPAGVFHMDDSGTTRMEFRPSREIKTPGQFCVTYEVKGGVASPTLKNLILASN